MTTSHVSLARLGCRLASLARRMVPHRVPCGRGTRPSSTSRAYRVAVGCSSFHVSQAYRVAELEASIATSCLPPSGLGAHHSSGSIGPLTGTGTRPPRRATHIGESGPMRRPR